MTTPKCFLVAYLLTGSGTFGQAAQREQEKQTWEEIQTHHQLWNTTHHEHRPIKKKLERVVRNKKQNGKTC